MKLSTRVRFGLRIMVQIAAEGDSQPVLARRVAAAQAISQAYVDQILVPLRAGGLLRSQRGPRGGFQLSRPADQITVLDIVEVLEGKLNLIDCVDSPNSCDRLVGCVTHPVWRKLTRAIQDTLSGITLAELRSDYEAMVCATNYVI
jgi:Rrf2 family protein